MYRDSKLGLCIDMSGPDGNVFQLMAYAKQLGRQCYPDDPECAFRAMQVAGDFSESYTCVTNMFEEYFPIVTLLNKDGGHDDAVVS